MGLVRESYKYIAEPYHCDRVSYSKDFKLNNDGIWKQQEGKTAILLRDKESKTKFLAIVDNEAFEHLIDVANYHREHPELEKEETE
jgi:hypothetical protein